MAIYVCCQAYISYNCWFVLNYALPVPFPSSPAFCFVSIVTPLGTLSSHPISSSVVYSTFVPYHVIHQSHTFSAVRLLCIPAYLHIFPCLTVSHPSSAFTSTSSNRLPILDNPHVHVYFISLFTAEPEPWSSEQDDNITVTEQDNNQTRIALSGRNTERGCQALHSSPPVGSRQEHCIDRFNTVPTPKVLGLAARRWIEWYFWSEF